MSMKLNRSAYEDLIAGDLEWLMKQPRTLERDHIAMIVKASPAHEYRPEPPRWVPVSERLPEEGVTVIAYRNGTVSLMWREDERGWVYTDGASGATPSHWTPLPPGPEGA